MKLFANLRTAAGLKATAIVSADIGEVLRALVQQHPALEFIIPEMESDLFTIELQVSEHAAWNSQYTLHFSKAA